MIQGEVPIESRRQLSVLRDILVISIDLNSTLKKNESMLIVLVLHVQDRKVVDHHEDFMH